MSAFAIHDYTRKIIGDPGRYGADYMLPAGTPRARIARWVAQYGYWLLPGYVWLLEKPAA